MKRLTTGLAAAAALVLLVSAGHACGFHKMDVTASIEEEEGVAMSTFDGSAVPLTLEEAVECPRDAFNCILPVE